MLAIDPSSLGSSAAGYAVFEAGVMVRSGKIPVASGVTHMRLPRLYDQIAALLPSPPDVLVIEEVHHSISGIELQYAIGVIIAGVRAPVVLQLPINVWKALAKSDPLYKKADEADAIKIGESLILLARRG